MLRAISTTRIVLILVALGITGDAYAQAKPKLETIRPKVQCGAMAGYTIPAANIALPTRGATIKTAEVKGPSRQPGDPRYLPEYCSMAGAIASADGQAPVINFVVHVPTLWNQGAWQFGGQGQNGTIPINLQGENVAVLRDGQPGYQGGSPLNELYPPNGPNPLGMGYATFGGDSGHQFAPGAKVSAQPPVGDPYYDPWLWNDEAWTNFAHAALKKTHDAAQVVLRHMYGTDARVTYFGGLSQGGREALTVVNRYPDDYEGVIAASPVAQLVSRIVQNTLRYQVEAKPGAWVPPAKAPAVRKELARVCDPLDGREDGIIHNYVGCSRRFDPTITPNPLANLRCPGGDDAGPHCLSDAQIATVNWWHSPGNYPYPLANGETEWPPYPVGGSGPGHLRAQPTATTETPQMPYLLGGFRVRSFNGMELDLVRHREQIQAMSKMMDVGTDWSNFLARGSKVIYISPSHDYLINARLHQRIFELALQKNDRTAMERGTRFYVSPHSGHGGSGTDENGQPVPQSVDFVSTLINWVERGVAPPDPLVQSSMLPEPPYTITKSRPLCRFPQYPHYNGTGDPNVAASYTCRTPNTGGTTN